MKMSEKSRIEKIASAKKRLQKFRDQKDGAAGGGGSSTKSKQRRPNSSAPSAADPAAEAAAVPQPAEDTASSLPPQPPPHHHHQQQQQEPSATELSGNGDAPPSSIVESNGSHEPSAAAASAAAAAASGAAIEQVDVADVSDTASVSGATESLMQLSQQINGIMSWDSPDQQTAQLAQQQQSLERRNVELASILEKRTEALEQSKRSQALYKDQLQRVQASLSAELASSEERHRRELQSAREQQASQAQTIGMLVAEKTELATQLAHAQRMCQQRLSELTEAQERVRAAKARQAEAEKAQAAAEQATSQLNSGGRELAKEAERLRAEVARLSSDRVELEQAAKELRARLAAKTQAAQGLEEQVRDLRRQLELAGVQLHQLGASRDRDGRAAVVELQSANADLTERLAQLTSERDSLAEQYREYTNRLGAEAKQLRAQVSTLTTERSQLVNRTAELEGELAGLADQLAAAREAENAALASVQQLKAQADEAGKLRDAEAEERQRLLEMVEDREAACERLRGEMRSAKADQQRLSDSVQSDRSCLSRALQQNRDLKSQLEELQTGFVAASNRGAELTQQLQAEQHLAKELASRLGEQEDELRELRQDLSAREEELRAVKLAYQSARETLLYRQPDSPGAVSGASPSSADAAAAVEAQQRLSQELAAAQARVNQLTASNSELKALLYRSQQQQQQQASATSKSQANTANSEDEAPTAAAGAEVVDGGRSRTQSTATLQTSVDQLESERNALLKTVEELKANAAAEAASPSDAAAVPHVSRAEFEEMQRARRQLEEKFHQAMDRVAQLQDEKERLEHTLMQLEIETETIGEYVTLYQYQRSQLHQRELEKEASLTQLAAEKEQMRLKLSELETLVRNLMHSQPQQQLHQLQQLASQSPDSSTYAAAESLHQQRPVMEGVHTSFSNPQSGSSEDPPVQQQSLAANRILDIISQLHDDATKDSVHVMQCSCCHGSVIDL
ncbi:hypothetical protein BOX15_Mlig018150g1 [Macrostomum lignano]|uniref:Golgin subfamily A conserved domain-containing protein n=2 Tax=Macrostomum lignano TaxID=282301 RepID=A0A267G6B9_9PLAT|nr:hypothetical protein BOX15_Mlig016972g1 [Macrostomum lignano]PAA81578.1 hypothetical protein BOX15_Mlig018150g1 [Macrostomum lignano]